ncbi:MAG: hypothetical protein HUJ65_02305, partial [Oscillospiraceae bacterium]|nr:hypothetical protein [Oscillospiraceae bacterium]
YLPPKRCIVMGVEVSNELEDMGRIRERLAQAERDLGVRSADRAFLRYYACREIDGKVVRNGLMWAPIEESDREQGQMW